MHGRLTHLPLRSGACACLPRGPSFCCGRAMRLSPSDDRTGGLRRVFRPRTKNRLMVPATSRVLGRWASQAAILVHVVRTMGGRPAPRARWTEASPNTVADSRVEHQTAATRQMSGRLTRHAPGHPPDCEASVQPGVVCAPIVTPLASAVARACAMAVTAAQPRGRLHVLPSRNSSPVKTPRIRSTATPPVPHRPRRQPSSGVHTAVRWRSFTRPSKPSAPSP